MFYNDYQAWEMSYQHTCKITMSLIAHALYNFFFRGSRILFSFINKADFYCHKLVLFLYNIQNNTWLLKEMELLFECSTRYPPLPLFSLVSYRVDHSKRNSISTRTHVYLSISSPVSISHSVSSLVIYFDCVHCETSLKLRFVRLK